MPALRPLAWAGIATRACRLPHCRPAGRSEGSEWLRGLIGGLRGGGAQRGGAQWGGGCTREALLQAHTRSLPAAVSNIAMAGGGQEG
eukprot:1179221-Prorocentrum_minimum.AAC.1